MLCNNAREFLLQHDAEGAALVLDLCYRLKQSLVTVGALFMLAEEAGIETSIHIIRRGIARALELGLMRIEPIRLTKAGRPTKFYHVYGREEVATKLRVRVQTTDALPDTAFRNASEYRRAIHLAFLKRNTGKQFTRKYLGSRLGVSKRTTWAYERNVPNLKKRASFRATLLTPARCAALPERERGALHLIASRINGIFEVETRIMPLIRALAWKHLREGWQVWLRQQGANIYEWVEFSEMAYLQGA